MLYLKCFTCKPYFHALYLPYFHPSVIVIKLVTTLSHSFYQHMYIPIGLSEQHINHIHPYQWLIILLVEMVFSQLSINNMDQLPG